MTYIQVSLKELINIWANAQLCSYLKKNKLSIHNACGHINNKKVLLCIFNSEHSLKK